MNHVPRAIPPANTSTNQNGAEVCDHLDAVALYTPKGVATMYQRNGTTDADVTTCRSELPAAPWWATPTRPALRLIRGGAA